MRKLMLVIAVIMVVGCARSVSTVPVAGITVTDYRGVEDYVFLENVMGVSSFYGVFQKKALNSARQVALISAKKMGATHLVFDGAQSNNSGSSMSGNAYNCDK